MKRFLWLIPAFAVAVSACGHSEAEYNARLHEIQQLQDQLHTITAERDRLNGQVASLRASSENMANRLRELGENVERLQATSAQTQTELDAAHRREEELRRAQQAAEQ